MDIYLISECPAELTLEPLPSGIGCYISDMCTAIRCCLEVDIIKTSVQFYITIDGCEKQITVGIEQLNTVKDISNYKFGKNFNLFIYFLTHIEKKCIIDITLKHKRFP
jgi:hypothetical protein